MIVILIISLISVVNCLEPEVTNDINDDIKMIIGKYLSKVPDIEPRYVINDKLSNVINHYFKGKISSLPLYKISLKIDRNPVKIPWTLDAVQETQDDSVMQRARSTEQQDKIDKHVRHYKVVKSSVLHSSTEKPDTTTEASTTVSPDTTTNATTTVSPDTTTNASTTVSPDTTTKASTVSPDTTTKTPMTMIPATTLSHLKKKQ